MVWVGWMDLQIIHDSTLVDIPKQWLKNRYAQTKDFPGDQRFLVKQTMEGTRLAINWLLKDG